MNMPNSERQCFAAVYDFSASATKKVSHLRDIEELAQLDEAPETRNRSQLLFLNGHPSPQWLNAIGGKFCVDPEFYHRHLDFRAAIGRPNYFTLPSLPSSSDTMTKLRINTIGYRQPRLGLSAQRNPQKYLDGLRSEATKSMVDYENILSMENKWKTGDSIVRDFAIHDAEHFTIEQDISICIDRTGHGWVAIAWLDIGASLERSPYGPWMPSKKQKEDQIEFLPTMQYKQKIALKNSAIPSASHCRESQEMGDFFQSASLIHLDYGRKLDREAAGANPLYTLSDLFRFAATSELQFLNMMATKVAKEMDPASLVQQENPTVANLLHSRQILERHLQRIDENIQFIDAQRNVSPRSSKVDATIESVKNDFRALASRAHELSEQCDRGMTIIMNNATIKESQRAVLQAEGVAKLTRLAFIFIPSSFTASIFGMNVKQFGVGGNVELWVYFLTTIPVIAIATLFLTVDVIGLWRSLFSLVSKRKKVRTNSFPT
ncbi:hypothetical protein ONS96_005404 [Cadophora gregata f. sp. sojae]|nr:hypothetical protein ONS96_005404 [Cadophora gregata f. sp. sojae]